MWWSFPPTPCPARYGRHSSRRSEREREKKEEEERQRRREEEERRRKEEEEQWLAEERMRRRWELWIDVCMCHFRTGDCVFFSSIVTGSEVVRVELGIETGV